jgi:Ser/Thr protein kinase RdoA (MazF antagonist)
MDPELLLSACRLYQTSPDLLIPLHGGFSNAVYYFPLQYISPHLQISENAKNGVLRIGVEDCPPEQTLGMLEWVRWLNREGAPVSAPLPSIHDRLLENLEQDGTRYTITAFVKAEGTLAEKIPPTDWTDELFHSIGRAAGKLHRISKGYQPSSPATTRPQWFDSYEIHEATNLLATSSDPAREKLAILISDLHNLPTTPPILA